MSWFSATGAALLTGCAIALTDWGDMHDGLWLTFLLALFLAERYRLPVGVSSRAEISVVLTPFVVAMHVVEDAQLVLVAAVAVVCASASRGRWGASARWEFAASAGAAATAVLLRHTLEEAGVLTGIPSLLTAGLVYALVRGAITWVPVFGTGPRHEPGLGAFFFVTAVQLIVGNSLVWAWAANKPFLTGTRVALVVGLVYLWILGWHRARQSAMAADTIQALPAGTLPPLESLAEALSVVAERELVLPYVRHTNNDLSVRDEDLAVRIAVVSGQGQCRVFTLTPSPEGELTDRTGQWSTQYPAWVSKVLVEGGQVEFSRDSHDRDYYFAVAAGPVAGPAIAVRVPVLEQTWPGRRRLGSLGAVYADWISVLLANYDDPTLDRAPQLRAACDRLIRLVAGDAPVDQVAEQVETVRSITALNVAASGAGSEPHPASADIPAGLPVGRPAAAGP